MRRASRAKGDPNDEEQEEDPDAKWKEEAYDEEGPRKGKGKGRARGKGRGKGRGRSAKGGTPEKTHHEAKQEETPAEGSSSSGNKPVEAAEPTAEPEILPPKPKKRKTSKQKESNNDNKTECTGEEKSKDMDECASQCSTEAVAGAETPRKKKPTKAKMTGKKTPLKGRSPKAIKTAAEALKKKVSPQDWNKCFRQGYKQSDVGTSSFQTKNLGHTKLEVMSGVWNVND